MFNTIVGAACKKDTPQYFMITPKVMNVICLSTHRDVLTHFYAARLNSFFLPSSTLRPCQSCASLMALISHQTPLIFVATFSTPFLYYFCRSYYTHNSHKDTATGTGIATGRQTERTAHTIVERVARNCRKHTLVVGKRMLSQSRQCGTP